MIAALWVLTEFSDGLADHPPVYWSVTRDTGREGNARYELMGGETSDVPRAHTRWGNYGSKAYAQQLVEELNADAKGEELSEAMDRAAAELHRPMEGAVPARVTPEQFIAEMRLDRPLEDRDFERVKASALLTDFDHLEWREAAHYVGMLARYTMQELGKKSEAVK